jgi:hypothetical protein
MKGPDAARGDHEQYMKTHFSHTLLNAILRLADAPERTLSRVTARLSGVPAEPAANATPDHIVRRLENVFESLSDLAFQSNITGALDLVCETLEAELPTAAVAAGLYDIDADQIRIVSARGLEHELVRGTVLSRARCMSGYAAEEAIVVSGETGSADWLGTTDAGSTVLLCPILHEANLLGMLALAEPLCTSSFEAHDLELVAYVAGQLAEFIQGHRLRPSLPAPPSSRGARNA